MGRLIIGLGNPGTQYYKNRHNVGFMAVDEIAQKFEFDESITSKKFEAEIGISDIGGEEVTMVKPLTFMNNSGKAVSAIANFYKIEPKDILVIYDDIDLELGVIRVREKGGAGTHNGMKSIIQDLGTDAFPRIRIGTESRGGTAPAKQDTSSFVLSNFHGEELQIAEKNIRKVPEIVESWIKEGIDKTMSKFN